MLEDRYKYIPDLDYDEDNKSRYQYDQSVPLRTHLVITSLPPEGLLAIRAVCNQLNTCVGPQHTDLPSTRGEDIRYMIAPACLSNVLLDNLLRSQFAADRDVLIIPTTAAAAIVRGGGRLAPTLITPLLESIRRSLFRCRWHIYVFIRDSDFIGIIVDRATPNSGRLWYVDSLKWNGHRELGTVQTFLIDEAQQSYRLPHQSPIEAVQIDCGVSPLWVYKSKHEGNCVAL